MPHRLTPLAGALLGSIVTACGGTQVTVETTDASKDARVDGGAAREAASEAGRDASHDAKEDAGTDSTTDAGLAAPRPVAPLSTSRVTSRRPTLRWVLPSGVTDATVDLCLDRACTMPIGAPATVTGTSYVPTSDLPIGVVFWRLHPSKVTTVSGPTWQFNVGARSATVDSSWGTTLDVNGDGYADLVVSAPVVSMGAGAIHLYLGGPSGLATTPVTVIGPGDADNTFGCSVASAGDVNGDGYADLVVGAYGVSANTGRAYLYLGSAMGLGTVPATTLTGTADAWLGFSVASAGDVNGDGYADVVVGADGEMVDTGSAYVYLGSATGLAATAAFTLVGPGGSGGYFGRSVAGAGDINGDGFADLVISAYGLGNAYIYLGGKSGPATTPSATLTGLASAWFGVSVASAGDVNGDGYADVVVGAAEAESGGSSSGSASVFLGGAAGLTTTPATTLSASPQGGEFYGDSVACAGDVNGDGYSDLIVGAYGLSGAGSPAPTDVGGAFVYLGGATGLSLAATVLSGPDVADAFFGQSVASAGDVNGDGYADVVVGAIGTPPSQTGGAYVFLGATTGVATVSTTLVSPDGANAGFGLCVFGAND